METNSILSITSTDIILLDKTKQKLVILNWNIEQLKFVFFQKIVNVKEIYSVQPFDFNYDGKMDLFITTLKDKQYNYQIHLMTETYSFSNTPNFEIGPSQSTATIMDYFENHTMGFLFFNDKLNKRQFGYYDKDQQISYLDFSQFLMKDCLSNFKQNIQTKQTLRTDMEWLKYKYLFDNSQVAQDIQELKFTDLNFNSIMDLNGDCRSDLFITGIQNGKQYSETYIRQLNGQFCLVDYSPIQQNLIGIQFQDLSNIIQKDYDGQFEMIQAFTKNDILSLSISKNIIKRYNHCKTESFTQNPFQQPYLIEYIDIKIKDPNLTFMPSHIRFFDFQKKGVPDLLITVDQNNQGKPLLMELVDCNIRDTCYNTSLSKKFTYSDLSQQIEKSMPQYNDYNMLYGSFFDYAEQGRSDLFYVIEKDNNIYIKSIYNYIDEQRLFLKFYGQNGESKHKMGTIYYGTCFTSTVTAQSGENWIAHFQLSQTQNSLLQTPYAFQGIGITNNYITDLTCGMPQKGKNYQEWTPIIPNSQLIFFPYTMKVDNWNINVFINPQNDVFTTILCSALLLIFLGSIIIFLQYLEKQEDIINQIQFEQFFR